VTTLDLAIVPEQSPANVARLLALLEVLDTRIRDRVIASRAEKSLAWRAGR
jgi:hypothetical protein